jgi:GTP cyclohydrolase I
VNAIHQEKTMSHDKGTDRQELALVLDLHPRHVSSEQLRRFEGYAAEILSALGMDLNTPATRDTPHRFIRALLESTEGYDGDPNLVKVFEAECRGGPDCRVTQVIEGPIHFYALCEHHALPFYGRAHVGYVARDNIIGLSKLIRLVRTFTKRFAVQERLGQQIADALDAILQPHGVAVFLEARHLCVEMRGVHEVAPMTRTTAWRDEYENSPALRSEFMAACGMQ